MNKRRANIAVQYGRLLRAAGMSDPFIELIEAPATASRWRTHPRNRPLQQDADAPSDPTANLTTA
jgi:hypothetical protein